MRGRAELVAGWDRLRGDAPIDAAIVGVAAGADRLFGHVGGGALFFGPYGAARFSQATREGTTRTEGTDGSAIVVTETASAVSEEREIELGLRVGWATDRVAIYASGGYVNARAGASQAVRVTTTNDVTGDVAVTEETSGGKVHRDGWRLGAGAEVTVVGDLFWKADYGYTTFDEDDDRHQVTTGVGLRF